MEIYTHNTEWEEQGQLYKDYMWEKDEKEKTNAISTERKF